MNQDEENQSVILRQRPNPLNVGGRIYGDENMRLVLRLIEEDGSEHPGAIKRSWRRFLSYDGTYKKTRVYSTADGRWFDNSGMRIEPPDDAEEDELSGPVLHT